MDQTAAIWAAGFVTIVLLVTFGSLAVRGQKRSRQHVRNRSEEHEAMVQAVSEWLADDRVRQALYDSGDATPPGLQSIRDKIGEMDEAAVRKAVAFLCHRRIPRRIIAKHVRRTRGLDEAEARGALLEWAGPLKEAV